MWKSGADGNSVTNMGETALWVAAREGRLGVAKLLVESGVDMNTADDRRGEV